MPTGPGAKPYRGRLRVDSTFYLELQFCHENGLPHSQFLSWDPVDRAKALAFCLEKAERCVLCGTATWEWDPAQGGSRFAYEPIEMYCHGCYLKAVTSQDTANNPGITVELAPTGTPEAAKRFVRERDAYLHRGHR